jgi:hypothetical protein
MRVKKVNRYYCDFCKKSGGSAGHMSNHERHCTMNPSRRCGMCPHVNGGNGTPMSEMVALLPDVEKYTHMGMLADAVVAGIVKLREVTEGCPVCVFAALRQTKTLEYARGLEGELLFDLKAEIQTAWQSVNAGQPSAYERFGGTR